MGVPPSHKASAFAQGYGGQDGGQAGPEFNNTPAESQEIDHSTA